MFDSVLAPCRAANSSSLCHYSLEYAERHFTPRLTLGALAVAVIFIVSLLTRLKGALPPGPRGWPFIGNVFDIPTSYQWKVFQQWSQHYKSDVLSLKFPGTTLVILNTMKAADELMVKRSHIYSDRPRMVMLNEVMRHDWILGIMPYGDRWRTSRRLFAQHVDKVATRPHEVTAIRRLLRRLLDSSEDLEKKLRLATGDFILSSAYGLDVKSADDFFIRLSQDALTSMIPGVHRGGYLVDIFPILKYLPSWFPGGGFKHTAAESRRMAHDARYLPFQFVQEQMEKGTAKPSLSSAFFQEVDKDSTPDYESRLEGVRDIMATMYLAGSETTILAMRNFIVGMAANPDVLKNGQAAVDAVLDGRLPSFEDRRAIPYVDALVNETLRWNGLSFVGVPHAVTEDDYYDGYFIPKGSLVIANIWAILQDESIYGPATDKFIPERFLTEEGRLKPEIDSDPEFGFGRRMCPGKEIVKEALWILIASFLAVFDICDAVDVDGAPLDPNKVANLSSPPSMSCVFRPRSDAAEALIRGGVED